MVKNKILPSKSKFLGWLNKLIYLFLRRLTLTGLIFIALLISFLDSQNNFFLNKIKNYSLDILSPALKIIDKTTDNMVLYFKNFGQVFTLYNDNVKLKAENLELKEYYLQYNLLKHKNEELSKLVKLVENIKPEFISARLVGMNQGILNHTALIVLNEKHSVKKGQLVINSLGLIGKIKESGIRFARVQLISDYNSRIPVTLLGSKLKAVASGNNSKCLDLLFLKDEGQVQVGELVVTSGDGDLITDGIMVGKVVVENNKLCIRSEIDFSKIEYVAIID